ncbi:DEAD/DEAH box helicase family protein [Candidatus Pacearchaeota archaeon]|nr:DEAD/DEAH box helicase family protein [Candidatus Pacearchaeota archaeon]
MLELYPHQTKAIGALFDYFNNSTGNPLVVAPVGSGKSLLIAEFIKQAIEQYSDTSFMVLAHVTELLTQNADHLMLQNPDITTSFYAAKLGKKSFSGQTIFASINSVYKKAYKIPHSIDIIIVDEAHLISPNDSAMYQSFLKDMLIINPHLKVIGFTGTNFRATEGRLTEGEGRLFTDVAYQIPMLYLIEKGFLCPLVTPAIKTRMSTVGVKSRSGDYIESQLQAAVDKDIITTACVDEIIHYGHNRKKWLIFTAGVTHCRHVMEELVGHGVLCDMVTGDTPTAKRNKTVDAFKNGDLQCLVNVGCFTTGFNCPEIDLMAFMRPTRSPVLYVQMGGRGMRTAPDKDDCCLLDFGDVIGEMGPIDLVDAQKAYTGDVIGEAPVKVCPECNSVCFAGVLECPDCGHRFPDMGEELKKTASTAAVMSNQIEPEWHDTINVSYKRHEKAGKTPSLCVTYNTLNGPFREWICYEHTGSPRERAAKWHKQMAPLLPLPKTVMGALSLTFRAPTRVLVRPEGKFFKIVDYDFD